MTLEGFTRAFKPLEILTEEQVQGIRSAALHVLQETGVRFEHERALKLFQEHGATVDFETMRVRMPPHLVEDSIRKCPSSFRMKARDPKNDLAVGGDTVYFGTFPGMQSVDLDTWERRTATRREYYDAVTVLDALEHLHFFSNYCPYFGFQGVPPAMAIPEGVAAVLRNSSKCLGTGCQDDSEVFTLLMADAVGCDVLGQLTCSSPLVYYRGAIETAFRVAHAGRPVQVISGVVMGGTGPATIAGSAVANTAELMAGVTLLQLIRPGTRTMVTHAVLPQDMRTGSPAFGAIENRLSQIVFSQLWRGYGVPTRTSLSGPSSSKQIDFQCGYEKALGAVTAALCGFHIVFLHGGIHGELTFHPLQAILDDDLAGMIGRLVQGVQVTDETLAVDLIERVGPIPGHFLDKAHTREWWKKEQFLPKSADRSPYADWVRAGKQGCIDRAKLRMQEILATHRVSQPLSEEQDARLTTILAEAYAHYRASGLVS